jgi:DNA polymerase-4
VEWLGKWGHDLHERACGLSRSPVSNEWERKSVGEQETFEQDTLDRSFVLDRARRLADGVFARMRADEFGGFRTVIITVRFENFVTMSRSLTVERALTTREALGETAERLLAPFFDARENPQRRRIRLIGVRVEKLERERPPEG